MGMIPGMSQLMTDGMEKQGVERLKRFMTVMDSMTEGELDNPKAAPELCHVAPTSSAKLCRPA